MLNSEKASAAVTQKMRRSSRVGDESTVRQNGVAGRSRAERGDAPDDEEAGGSPVDIQDDEDNDPARRREIRSKYRDLINSVQRESISCPRV